MLFFQDLVDMSIDEILITFPDFVKPQFKIARSIDALIDTPLDNLSMVDYRF